jgi:hypothetical protein
LAVITADAKETACTVQMDFATVISTSVGVTSPTASEIRYTNIYIYIFVLLLL